MVIQYKRGYGPQYTVHSKLSLLPIWRETWGIKVPIEEEPSQPPLTLLCVSNHLLSLIIVAVERGLHESFIQVFLIPYLFISLINKTCCRSHHNHVQCFVCFRYWFMIIEHVLWNMFLLRPKFPTSGIRAGLHVWIYWVKLIFVWTLPFEWSFMFFPQFCINLMQYHKQAQLPNENCFSDIENFTMTQVKYLNAPSGS